MRLYESDRKILISGDHILFDITPNISFWTDSKNPPKVYLPSLEKVLALDMDLILPGHRRIWNSHKNTITELKAHHQARLNKVLFTLRDGTKTAYQIAPSITWDIDYASWDAFPPQQKWFALGETAAQVECLEQTNAVYRKNQERHKTCSPQSDKQSW